MKITVIEHEEFVEYVSETDASDEVLEEELANLKKQILSDIAEKNLTRVLFNLMGNSNAPNQMAKYRLGLNWGEEFGTVRCGVLATASKLDHFWETVASNTGGFVKSSGDRDEIVAWLLSE